MEIFKFTLQYTSWTILYGKDHNKVMIMIS